MYKCVIFAICFLRHQIKIVTQHLESSRKATSHMNHARETGMEVKGRSDKLLALDGTERTKNTQSTVELHTVNDG